VKQWYVVHTKPRQEAVAEDNLLRQGFEPYLPRCRLKRRRRGQWTTAVEALFPRYLFLHVDLERTNTASVRSTRGAVGFVRFGGQPSTVPEQLIDVLVRRADMESGLHDVGQHRFCRGQKVEIIEGPLAGLEAVFVADRGEDRVVLLFNLLGRQNTLAVPRERVVPAA
jgi:transcriptional antiterminator RfaH